MANNKVSISGVINLVASDIETFLIDMSSDREYSKREIVNRLHASASKVATALEAFGYDTDKTIPLDRLETKERINNICKDLEPRVAGKDYYLILGYENKGSHN